ncbi:MAG: phosphotransferase family protein [Solirubrobacterales bacterium]
MADTATRDIVETPEQAQLLELPPLVITDTLASYLSEQLPGDDAPLGFERIGDGHSNITYLVTRGSDRFVLRRPPRPPLPPSAHDVLREWRLLDSIKDTPARVPRPLLACPDESVIGAPFYVMEYLEGSVITTDIPDALDNPQQRLGIGFELVDSLAEVHTVDWLACGLEGYGKPTGYLERQLRRFSGLWEHNKTRELPVLEQVTGWLRENMPQSGSATIVHGDYRLGNTMFAPEAPAKLIAIFDWELSTIGDPLADLGYMTTLWQQAGDPENELTALGAATRREGFPTREQLIARYEEKTGRSMTNFAWYQTLALWKSAVFLEGNYKRLLAGTTDDQWYKLLEFGVPGLAERAWAVSQGEVT